MLFRSDGFFVSNFVGKTSFTAVNFIFPVLMILGAAGFMLGTGGGALIAKIMGEGKREEANRLFSLVIYTGIGCGTALAAVGLLLIRPIAAALGAQGQMLEDSVTYARIILLAIPAFVLQYEFQCLFSTAEKPALGLYVTVAAGVTNMVLDALFVAAFRWGLEGAAAATAVSQCVGGVIPLIYFARPNSSLLRLGRTRFDGRALWKTCTNGVSELMSSISGSVVSMLYNAQLLGRPLSLLFVGYDAGLLELTARAFTIFSFCFLFSGFAIFGSSFFTALNNGLVSAAISFLRTLVFQAAAVLIFPLIWEVDGIWLSIVAAEALAVAVTAAFLWGMRKKYQY